MKVKFSNQELARLMVEPTMADLEALEELHPLLVGKHMMHPEFRKTGDCRPRITCCSDSIFVESVLQEEHEFLQDYKRETSVEIHVNQVVVSLSSAQVKFYAAVKAAVGELVVFR